MSDDAYVLCERDEHDVALVRLNRPPMNPLSQAMLAALRDVARELANDGSVKAVVVAGSEKAFAAGADIDEFGDQAQAAEIERGFRDAFDAVESIPRPVIAAVRGYALGGGLELAMACDLRVASEKVRVGQPEILLGVIPGAGGTQRLPALVGPAHAKEMIWSGRQVRAEEAHTIGLVDKVVPDDEVEHAALRWAAELAKGAVVAMGLAKRVINGGRGVPMPNALDAEAEAFVEVFGTEDAQTGVQSFREHGPGKARFSGR
jgi:enoyl-CoA hydratase/carnithine racemase